MGLGEVLGVEVGLGEVLGVEAELGGALGGAEALRVWGGECEGLQEGVAEEEGAKVITRMRWLSESATYTLPEVSTATPKGTLNSAAVPTPSVEPNVVPVVLPPASVMTVRLG